MKTVQTGACRSLDRIDKGPLLIQIFILHEAASMEMVTCRRPSKSLEHNVFQSALHRKVVARDKC